MAAFKRDIAVLFFPLLVACQSHPITESESGCIDALCYRVCEKALLESYNGVGNLIFVTRAECNSDTDCQCAFGCEAFACNAYCEDQGAATGQCEALSCVCAGQMDGGVVDGG